MSTLKWSRHKILSFLGGSDLTSQRVSSLTLDLLLLRGPSSVSARDWTLDSSSGYEVRCI